MFRRGLIAVVALVSFCSFAHAQDDDLPNADDLAQAASKRFPQPVRVGDLIHRWVLEPTEARTVLGRVEDVVREKDGTIAVVVDYGGAFGFFTHPIAVPVNAMALLGNEMTILEYDPGQLDGFPRYAAGSATSLPRALSIRVPLTKPSH